MGNDLEIKFDTSKLEKAIRMVPNVLRVDLADAYDHIGRSFFKKFFSERMKGPPGIRGFQIFRFFKYRVLKATSDIMDSGVEFYTPSSIARQHETGATLTSERGFAIPFSSKYRPEMYTKGGQLRKRYKDLRNIKNIRKVKLKTGYFWATFTRKNPSEIKPMYAIKNIIVLKKRLGFYDTFYAHAPQQVQILNKAVMKAMNRIRV